MNTPTIKAQKYHKTCLISICFTATLILIYLFSLPKVYLANDDSSIQMVLSGAMTGGVPYPTHLFINAAISIPISWLYSIFPRFPWWYLIMEGMLTVSTAVMIYYVLKQSQNDRFQYFYACIIICLYGYGIILYNMSRINFTVIPGFMGGGIVSAIMASSHLKKRKKNIYLFTIIAYIIAFSFRWEAGLVVLCYILLAFLNDCLHFLGSFRSLYKYLLVCCAIIAITYMVYNANQHLQEETNGKECMTFHEARAEYLDYPHLTYESNPVMYEEQGWDQTVYNLVKCWCFMDEHVTAESFAKLSQKRLSIHLPSVEELKLILHNEERRELILIWLVSVIFWLSFCVFAFDWRRLLIGLLNLTGTIVIIGILACSGRIIYRAFVPCIIPSFAIFMSLSVEESSKKRAPVIVMAVLLAIVLGMLLPIAHKLNYDEEWIQYSLAKREKERIINAYALNHNEEVYIADSGYLWCQVDPRINYKGTHSNVIAWGGNMYDTDVYKRQLKINGLENRLTSDVFREKNIHYLGGIDIEQEKYIDPSSTLGAIYKWMVEHNDAIGISKIDVIDKEFCVYDFVYEDTQYIYENYYTIKNGIPVLEKVTIDY